MKKLKLIMLVIVAVITFTSCEKEVIEPLNNHDGSQDINWDSIARVDSINQRIQFIEDSINKRIADSLYIIECHEEYIRIDSIMRYINEHDINDSGITDTVEYFLYLNPMLKNNIWYTITITLNTTNELSCNGKKYTIKMQRTPNDGNPYNIKYGYYYFIYNPDGKFYCIFNPNGDNSNRNGIYIPSEKLFY